MIRTDHKKITQIFSTIQVEDDDKAIVWVGNNLIYNFSGFFDKNYNM